MAGHLVGLGEGMLEVALAGAYLAARLTGTAGPDALRDAVAYAAATTTARGCAAAYPTRRPVPGRTGGT